MNTRKLLVVLIVVFGIEVAVAQQPPLGLPRLQVPSDNPLSQAKVELGKRLFFDKRLSLDDTISCATCHDPAKGWSNGQAVATGFLGMKGNRSAPTIVNAAYQFYQFADGRAERLEGQVRFPIEDSIEMNMPISVLALKLNSIERYRQQFQKVFGNDATPKNIAKAIATFERTLLAGDSPFDRFKTGDTSALSNSAQRGMRVFFDQANCSSCHSGPLFTDGVFHNIGTGARRADPGRFAVTRRESDRGAFKTPTLRDIARTAPYMHDGRFRTLRQVVDFYSRGAVANRNLDEDIFALNLTERQKVDLVEFLRRGLTSKSYPYMEAPELWK